MTEFHEDGSLAPLHDGWIFVFGSNLAGRHGRGAARVALQRFGARYGVGEGLSGDSYAIPTKDASLRVLSLREIKAGVDRFLAVALANKDARYFVTRVGCGLAGYHDCVIAPMFARAPRERCSFANTWSDCL